ncbi:MAG: TIR domain-containing protein [Acidobacteriota bacterium]
MPPDVSVDPGAAASRPPLDRSADGHTFVCYAREDSEFVRRLTAELSARASRTWVDTELAPGADWDRSIDERLRTCANLLIVLSPAAVASAEVRGELRTALNLAKPIVPVLYQACDIPRQLQTVQYLDFTSANSDDAAWDALAAALLSVSDDTPQGRHRPDRPAGRDLRNRQDFLADVKSEAAGRLAQSIHGGMLNVLKEKQPDQVTRRWDPDVRIPHQPRAPLAPEVRIVQLFDDESVGGRLLILGAPGSGKTTALLELAQALLERAEKDTSEPMPVLCNLSSWRKDGHDLAEWLVDHLKTKYGVRMACGRAWLAERQLVPLFDGLDEVAPEHQEPCVESINRFQQDYRPPHLVVCCRLAEYENYQIKLQLNGAVRLLPLEDEQIRQYLVQAESPALWDGIRGDEKTIELARTPLLLRIITVAYEEMPAEDWQRVTPASERQARLFDVYIRRLLSGDAAARPFSKARTIHWLVWLARTMKEHGQAELMIEHLQPAWLAPGARRVLYRGGVAMAGAAAFFLAMSLGLGLFGWIPRGAIGVEYLNVSARTPGLELWYRHDWLFVAMMGLAAGLTMAARKTIRPIETLAWSWTKGWHGMAAGLRTMSLAGLHHLTYVGSVIGLLIGVSTVRDQWLGEHISPELTRFSMAGNIAGAIALLALAAAILLTVRRGGWRAGGPGGPRRGSAADAIVSGLALGAGAWPIMGPLFGALAGVSIGLIVRFGGGANPLSAARFAGALVAGLIGGFGCGAISWWTQSVPSGFIGSVGVWMLGGVGVAATAALATGLAGGFARAGAAPAQPGAARWRRRTRTALLIGGSIAAAAGLMAVAARHAGEFGVVRGVVLMTARLGWAWITGLWVALGVAVIAAVLGLIMGAFLGALFGLLSGLTGPDVERRTAPNQGIRQSAKNVGVFALVGVLVVGLPYSLFNLAAGVVWTRTAPSVLDWVNLGLGPAMLFGVMGGFVPGVACIQHFTLRSVLWFFGLAPWRYARFLNYATERMLLQRVGGRYRFIHDLLREHFAAMGGTSA